MSVLKSRRGESKGIYVNIANEIYLQTLGFLTRLSARYSRLLSADVMRLASEVLDHCEKANSIYPSSEKRVEMREAHLLEARAALMALDVHMSHVYEVMMQNPEGCFAGKSNGKRIAPADAKARLEKMAQSLGELIDDENGKLTALIKNNKPINKTE